MPVRATKRGAARTQLERDCDVLICGGSFAGLAAARELRSSGAEVLIIDRYELGERQTSACGIPTVWLDGLSLQASHLQTFDELLVHTPWASSRWQLPWSFSTFDYRELCGLLWEQTDLAEDKYETAKVDGITQAGDCFSRARSGRHATLDQGQPEDDGSRTPAGNPPGSMHTVHTDRGDIRAPLVIDCLGWRRVLSGRASIQPPDAPLSRGLEVHPSGRAEEMELWIDPRYVRAGYGWSFPARDEVRIGIGSFWPSHHVKEPTVRLTEDLGRQPDGYQGNWIPHRLRPAVEDGVFFVGDSAGHCLPLTAEGIRTALYFGLACGRELRAVLDGRQSREQALARYGSFSDSHERKFRWLLNSQKVIGRLTPTRSITWLARALTDRRFSAWAFNHYLDIAPVSFINEGPALKTPITPGRRLERATA